jgi:hypothetical protein
MTAWRLFALQIATLACAACSTAEDVQDDGSTTGTVPAAVITATVLHYQEQEAGTDSYPVRVLISPEYMRIDDGYAESDFALLDRAARSIFSVSHDDRSILVIQHTTAGHTLPPGIHMEQDRVVDAEAPRVAGKQPVHRRFITNEVVCHEAVVVPGLLEEAARALIEYEETLASRQQENLAITPQAMQSGCFLTRYVYAPARHLRQGFPILEWDNEGYRRQLVDYHEAEQVPGELFRLPGDYQRFSLGDAPPGL